MEAKESTFSNNLQNCAKYACWHHGHTINLSSQQQNELIYFYFIMSQRHIMGTSRFT